jgi:benzil reductase ((S)-benzoin forming)
VTGAGGGLGEAIAVTSAKRGAALVLVGRNERTLAVAGARCEAAGATAVARVTADLGRRPGVEHVATALGGGLLGGYRTVMLFNNASTIEPICSFEELSFDDMERALRVNVSAAVALAAAVVHLARELNAAETYVVNISSGVAVNAVMGWSAYCVSKAALNMVTKCVAVETASAPRPVQSLAINPGPLDTRMQERIRNSDKIKSPAAEKFARMHSEGKLKKPEDVAAQLFDILDHRRFASGDFVDFNQLP